MKQIILFTLCTSFFISNSFAQVSRVTEVINKVAPVNWTISCDKHKSSVPYLKKWMIGFLSEKLTDLVELNDNYEEHIIELLKQRTLIISCTATSDFAKNTAARYSSPKYDFFWRTGKYQVIKPSVIRIPTLFTVVSDVVKNSNANLPDLTLQEIDKSIPLYIKNNVLHEFLHFLQLGNFNTEKHNSVNNKNVVYDMVYACAGHLIAPEPLESIISLIDLNNRAKNTDQNLFNNSLYQINTLKDEFYHERYNFCLTCSSGVKKDRPLIRHRQRFNYGHLPNFTTSREKYESEVTKNKCRNVADKAKAKMFE